MMKIMVNKELVEYIQKAREKKMPDDKIVGFLKDAGWSEGDIKDSREALDQSFPVPPSPTFHQAPTDAHGGHLWDSFEHVLMFISLYVFAVSFGLILHTFVDKYLPNTTGYYRTYSSYVSSLQDTLLRGYVSAVIVSYPIFVFLFLRIIKRTINNPVLNTLRSRTILIYFTLVITFIVMLSNVISIVNGLLYGNASLNFAAHFVITVGISGFIFGYFLGQIKKHQKIA